ncbi:MAG: hypothetical protein ACM3UZ_10280 [Acidobacteriota bacterium]
MDRAFYSEIRQIVKDDFQKYMHGSYGFSFTAATSKIQDDYLNSIHLDEIEKALFSLAIAVECKKQGELRIDIKTNLERMIQDKVLDNYDDPLTPEDKGIIALDLQVIGILVK